MHENVKCYRSVTLHIRNMLHTTSVTGYEGVTVLLILLIGDRLLGVVSIRKWSCLLESGSDDSWVNNFPVGATINRLGVFVSLVNFIS